MLKARSTMNLGRFYSFIEKFIGDKFAKYGAFVARHAWKVIIGSIIMNGLFALGMLRLKVEIDVLNTYPPIGNKAKENEEKIDSIFPASYHDNYFSYQEPRFNNWAIVIIRSTSGNILDRSQLSQVAQIDTDLHNMAVTRDDGSTFKLFDVCAKNNGSCHVGGSLFFHPDFLAAMDINMILYPYFPIDSQIVDNSFFIGGKVEQNAFGFLTGVQYIKLIYNLIPADDRADDNLDWAHAFQRKMEQFKNPDLDIAYSHFMSNSEELWTNIMGDILKFVATFFVMIVYSMVCCLSYRVSNQVGQRVMLAVGGVLAASLGIGSGFGMSALIGREFMPAAGVIPFLVIGIGLDGMFLFLSGIAGAQGLASVEEKMATTLRVSGVGITITSVTDLVAFLTGASSSFPVVRNFSIYTAFSVLFCYINIMTMFAACIAINERRVAASRHFFTFRKIQAKSEAEHSDNSRMATFWCSGWAPKSRAEVEGVIDKIIRWALPKVVLNIPAKICIGLVFAGYLAAGIYGCVHLKTGMEFSQTVLPDSYSYKFMNWTEDIMPQILSVQFVLPDKHEYSKESTQAKIDQLVSSIKAQENYDSNWEVNWLESYKVSPFYTNISEASFVTNLKSFLLLSSSASFRNDIVFDDSGTSITASRFYVRSVHIDSLELQGKFLLTTRDLEDSSPINCFGHSSIFIVTEADVLILEQTLQFVGIALVIVFVITCAFMPHPILILFVTLTVTMITVGVFGFLFYIDVTLSYITMIQMIMSIGFSVDFTAHICHGYMISKGDSRDERVKQSFDKAGAPIFHGAVSTVLGVLVLLIAGNSYIFKTFSAVLSFIILFGITHALLLLPVVLSLIGPKFIVEQSDGTIKPKINVSNGHIDTAINHRELKKETNCYKDKEGKVNMAFEFNRHCSSYRLKCVNGTTSWNRTQEHGNV